MRTFTGLMLVLMAIGGPPQPRTTVADQVMTLTRDTHWKLISSIAIRFRTFHPQGMVRIGDAFYVSSVEVKTPTRRFQTSANGLDRDTGQGVGHLFKIDPAGNLLGEITIGEGAIYHPGGMDFDGVNIWVAVAEYRPNSRSIVYRVDPRTMAAVEVLRVGDHIGAVAYDVDDRTLHGASWGSRRFYTWKVARGAVRATPGQPRIVQNPSHYIDYQDCKYAGRHRMICSGVTEFHVPNGSPFRLGGIDLVDLRDGRPLHQAPILLWTPSGFDMTHNPVWLESTPAGLRAYFMPEDDSSTLYMYESSS